MAYRRTLTAVAAAAALLGSAACRQAAREGGTMVEREGPRIVKVARDAAKPAPAPPARSEKTRMRDKYGDLIELGKEGGKEFGKEGVPKAYDHLRSEPLGNTAR